MRSNNWRSSRSLGFVIGVAAIAIGGALTLKPFSSLGALAVFVAASLVLTGLGEFVTGRAGPRPWPSRIVGAVLIVTGVVAFLVPGATVRLVGTVVVVGLVIGGLARLAMGLRNRSEERSVPLVSGLACLVLGIIALLWRDATIHVVTLLVGPVAVIFGIGQLVRAMIGQRLWQPGRVVRAPRRGWS